MALVVEDGSGLPDAESYLDVAGLRSYAVGRGRETPQQDAAVEAALRRGTAYLDAHYRARWPGARTNGRSQSLAWPRRDASDADGVELADDEIPGEVITASAEAALRELAAPGSLSPDLPRGGTVKRKKVKAGPVETETEYADGAGGETVFVQIDGILSGLLTALPSATRVTTLMRA